MAFEKLKQNINAEKEIIVEIFALESQLENTETLAGEKRAEGTPENVISSLLQQLKIINNSTIILLSSLTPYKKIQPIKEEEKLVKIEYPLPSEKRFNVLIRKKDREKFLKELNLNYALLKKLRKRKIKTGEDRIVEVKKVGFYSKLSNKIFLKLSSNLAQKNEFKKLGVNLKKSNLPFLLTTYISVSILTSCLIFFAALIYFIVFLFFSLSPEIILLNFLILFFFPTISFFSFYLYPYLEGKSISSRIDQELPFVAMHMSAIAGSGIEPSQIFKIIAVGEEYSETRKEIKKIMNQINLYGYDLLTALKIVSRETSSKKFSELLNGLITTISGGGSLTEFLNKRAETLLFGYRLEMEKETKSAETFMDLYISLVITTPMIMTLLLVLISIGMGGSMGLSLNQLSVVMVLIVSLINIVFLAILHFKH